MKSLIFFAALVITAVFGRQGFGPTDQEWGYVTVRDGAHMFWWLHYTTATVNATERPLVIWLQGGPGASSTGYGNFAELGPLDLDLKPRNTSWVNDVNVLFVDNPVGTGFSYVDEKQYAANNTQIAKDFVVLLQGFYKDQPQFEDVPLYIFCESYGGKMTAEISFYLWQASQDKNIRSNFKGIGLGDSWISPIDSVLTWAPYLYNLGIVSAKGLKELNERAQLVKHEVDSGNWDKATSLWSQYEMMIESETSNVDFYNVLTEITAWLPSAGKMINSPLKEDVNEIMNNQVRVALHISQEWDLQSGNVFDFLVNDFMKPVTDVVERLLNETNIKVAVYNGQLDLIVDTPGTIQWVDRLKWNGAEEWKKSWRTTFPGQSVYEGYSQTVGNFSFYWVLRSGHMVPLDNPKAMKYILQEVTNNFTVNSNFL